MRTKYTTELANLAMRVSKTDLQDPMQLILLNIQFAALSVLATAVLKEGEKEDDELA